MSTTSKREIIVEVSNRTGMTQQQVLEVVGATFDLMAERLADGDSVGIRNFGTFNVREAKGKIGRNPRNPSQQVVIPDRATVKFRPGKELRDKVARLLPKIQQS